MKKSFAILVFFFTLIISTNQVYSFGFLKELGKGLGVDEKTLDLLDKGLKVVKSLAPIGYEEEKALGGAIAIEVFRRYGGMYNDDKLLKYVTTVGRIIASTSDRADIDYYFAILNNKESNAFAAPGGYVFITIGLLKTLKNEAQLAGVLAHEIGHITGKHTLKALQRSKRLSGVSELTLTALDKNPKLFSNIIKDVTKKLFDEGLDQSMEYEADSLGVEYASRAGYNPKGLSGFLEVLKVIHGKEESVFFKTHPDTSSRIQKLKDNVLPKFKNLNSYPLLSKRFNNTTSHIR